MGYPVKLANLSVIKDHAGLILISVDSYGDLQVNISSIIQDIHSIIIKDYAGHILISVDYCGDLQLNISRIIQDIHVVKLSRIVQDIHSMNIKDVFLGEKSGSGIWFFQKSVKSISRRFLNFFNGNNLTKILRSTL